MTVKFLSENVIESRHLYETNMLPSLSRYLDTIKLIRLSGQKIGKSTSLFPKIDTNLSITLRNVNYYKKTFNKLIKSKEISS